MQETLNTLSERLDNIDRRDWKIHHTGIHADDQYQGLMDPEEGEEKESALRQELDTSVEEATVVESVL